MKRGTQLGPYEILDLLGVGGMGEVYRAHDAKLGRDVAIKVLTETFARDAERLTRFQREAKMLAALNHPNIAAIYGFEDSGDVHALVMELVEGPTLADRIKQGAIPVDEALPIAKQIAEAMEYAHERGIIHRDLKPANIKVSSDDAVKILDFGLAKALDTDTSAGDMANSPTISRLATQAGIILGTASYMSPEQAKGKAVDRRTDIWAFGCVFYEMLTGKMAFSGESITETLAAVIREEPDWSLLPADTPTGIRNLLARCLKKDARQRVQAIGDARIAIEEILAGAPAEAQSASPIVGRRSRREIVAWTLVVALALAGIGFGIWTALRPHAQEQPSVLAFIPAPPGTSFRDSNFDAGPVVVSPDGTQLAFTAIDDEGVTKLWIRPLGSEQASPLARTDDASSPFWSPDSHSLGFFAGDKLKTVDLDNGSVQVLGDSKCNVRGAWNKTGTILFTPDCHSPLSEIPASGGDPRPATKLEVNEVQHREPVFLPDGRSFLYGANGKDNSFSIWAASLDSSDKKLVLRDAHTPEYESGYLLFVGSGNRIFAQPFDPVSETLSGKAIPLGEAQTFSVSQNGVLAYQGGSPAGHPEWFDREGNSLGVVGKTAVYQSVAISPDSARVLADIKDAQSGAFDLWSLPAAGGVGTRLTFGPADKIFTVWSPDGKFIAYSCRPNGQPAICRKPADGSGVEEVLSTPSGVSDIKVVDWSPDGRYLSVDEIPEENQREEVWALPLSGDQMSGDQKQFRPAPTTSTQYTGTFSPDGHWLAYFSYESGRPEVYVVPFPGPGGKFQISQTGGWLTHWDKSNRLYFLTLGNRLMEADLDLSQKSVQVKAIHPLFQLALPISNGPLFDVAADGSRFLVVSAVDPSASAITVILNWQAALKGQ